MKTKEFTLKITVGIMDNKWCKETLEGCIVLTPGTVVALTPINDQGTRYNCVPKVDKYTGSGIICSPVILRACNEINYPTLDDLENWTFDNAHCETPLGYITEPDGHDQFGWASWLMVLGII